MRRLICLAALAALAGCGGGGASGKPSAETATPAASRDEVVASIGSEGGFDAQKIYKDEAPGVVTVLSQFGSEGGEGSGFVLNDEGEIVTNAHVVTTGEGAAIRRASAVYVEFADGNQVPAEVRGYDPDADIALLEVDPAGLTLHPLPLGSSAHVVVLIGVTVFQAESTGRSGLRAQSFLARNIRAQESNFSSLAFLSSSACGVYFGRNCLR